MLLGLLICLDRYLYLAQSHQWLKQVVDLKEDKDQYCCDVEKNALEGGTSDSGRLAYFDNAGKKPTTV